MQVHDPDCKRERLYLNRTICHFFHYQLSTVNYPLCALVSLVSIAIVQLATIRYQLSLGDETWLWYGVQRTLHGEWPLRDFQAYDPGRYLWLDWWLRLCRSDHLLTLRYGLAIFQFAALFPAALLAARVLKRRWLWIPFTLLISAWMVPRHKLPDIAITAWMLCALVWLIDNPTRWRYRLAGVLIGLIWMMGRNHAMYAMISVVVVWGFLCWFDKSGFRSYLGRFGWMMQGLVIGSLPMILLLLIVPHYASSYWQIVINRQIEIGATNLGVPIPWPWKSQSAWNSFDGLIDRSTGSGFVLLPMLAISGLVLLIRCRSSKDAQARSVLLAATATTIGWTNHAFSRADLGHLAQIGMPIAFLLIAIPPLMPGRLKSVTKISSAVIIFAITILITVRLNPAISAWVRPGESYNWEKIDGTMYYVPITSTRWCRIVGEVVRKAGPHPSILIAPYQAGLYAVYRLKCPIFESYPLYPATKEEQLQAIADLKKHNTQWVVCWPYRMDGRADLGFDQTDALVWQYIQQNFKKVSLPTPTGDALVLRKDSPSSTRISQFGK